jgi:hypothetical protein
MLSFLLLYLLQIYGFSMSYGGKVLNFRLALHFVALKMGTQQESPCGKRAQNLVFREKRYIFAAISNEDRFDCLQPLQKC